MGRMIELESSSKGGQDMQKALKMYRVKASDLVSLRFYLSRLLLTLGFEVVDEQSHTIDGTDCKNKLIY